MILTWKNMIDLIVFLMVWLIWLNEVEWTQKKKKKNNFVIDWFDNPII
jgi:hypothetical protein